MIHMNMQLTLREGADSGAFNEARETGKEGARHGEDDGQGKEAV